MKRQWTFALFLAMSGLVTASCEEVDVQAIPEPELVVVDSESGNTSAGAVAAEEPFLVDFGEVNIDGTEIRTLELKNPGTGQLRISEIRLVEDNLGDARCDGLQRGFGFVSQAERETPVKVEPGEAHRLRISFSPGFAGPHCMALVLVSNVKERSEHVIYLSGMGSGGRLCTVPSDASEVDFGPVFVGDTETREVTLESCGNKPVVLEASTVDPNPDDAFGLVAPPAWPQTLEPGAQLVVEVSFSPTLVRSYRDSLGGKLKLTAGAPYPGEYFIALLGTGAEKPRCVLAAIPAAVNFGAVAGDVGETDTTMLLRNNGACHCEITSFSPVTMDAQAPGADAGTFSLSAPPPLPLFLKGNAPGSPECTVQADPPSSTTTLTVRYTFPPRLTGFVERGHFEIASNDPVSNPLRVDIQANGGGAPHCRLQIEPEAPDSGMSLQIKEVLRRWGLVRFGNVNLHFERQQAITLENVGNNDCVIHEIKWRQPWTPDNEFGFASEAGTPMTLPALVDQRLAPGEMATYFATFNPTRPAPSSMMNMSCLTAGYCATLTSSIGMENCLDTPCVWGNGIDIVTGLPGEPATADTITDQSILGEYAVPGTFSIGIMGRPTEPAIDVIPGEVDFGIITVGCGSEERTIKVYNTGSEALTVTRLEIVPVVSPDEFRITASLVPPNYDVQPGGQPMLINVRFIPRREGTHRGDVIIYALEEGEEVPMFTIPLLGEGTTEDHATDVFQQLQDPQVDVLWVVDDSGSMSGETALLAENFPSFFSETNINNVDYHIAVTTTLTRDGCVPDWSNPTDPCADTPPHEKSGYFTACSGNDKWITPATADPEDEFYCNVKVHDAANVRPIRPSSDSAEGGLLAAKQFLSPPKIDDPEINGGFMRDDAKLYVIMVSDEVDQSDGPTDLYVDFFRNLKGFRNAGLVNVSAIAGALDGSCATAAAAPRYEDVATAMGGVFHDLCNEDWSAMLQSLAFDTFGLKIQYFLSRGAASAAAIEVCVDVNDLSGVTGPCPGTVVPMHNEGDADGWFYDAGSNSVVFNPGSVPERGYWVRVDYDTACLPLQP